MTHGHSRGWKCSYCPTSSLVRSNFKMIDNKPVCVACADIGFNSWNMGSLKNYEQRLYDEDDHESRMWVVEEIQRRA